jgi:hypothetical protein
MGLCKRQHARLQPPSKPTNNAHLESFNATVRLECFGGIGSVRSWIWM